MSFRTFASTLDAMRIRPDVSIQVIKGSVGLEAVIPAALVDAFNLCIPSARTLGSQGARNRDGGDLGSMSVIT